MAGRSKILIVTILLLLTGVIVLGVLFYSKHNSHSRLGVFLYQRQDSCSRIGYDDFDPRNCPGLLMLDSARFIRESESGIRSRSKLSKNWRITTKCLESDDSYADCVGEGIEGRDDFVPLKWMGEQGNNHFDPKRIIRNIQKAEGEQKAEFIRQLWCDTKHALSLVEEYTNLNEELKDSQKKLAQMTLSNPRLQAISARVLLQAEGTQKVLRLDDFATIWAISGGDPKTFRLQLESRVVEIDPGFTNDDVDEVIRKADTILSNDTNRVELAQYLSENAHAVDLVLQMEETEAIAKEFDSKIELLNKTAREMTGKDFATAIGMKETILEKEWSDETISCNTDEFDGKIELQGNN